VSEPEQRPLLDPDYPAFPTTGAQPAYPAPAPRVPRRTAANWALGLSIVPLGITLIAGVITAIVVLAGRDDGTDRGKGRAVAALVVAGGWVVVAVLVAVAIPLVADADRDDDGRLTAAGRSLVLDLAPGDCLPEPRSDGEAFVVEVVPCDQAHVGEVYATWDLEGEWTERQKVDQVATAGCLDRFADYVGLPLRRSDADVYFYQPMNQAQYREDPGVICIAETGSRTASLQDDPPLRPGKRKAGVEA
jgi:hypothetical protein